MPRKKKMTKTTSLSRAKKNKNLITEQENVQLAALKEAEREIQKELFAKTEEAIKLYNPEKNNFKTLNKSNKEYLRTYMAAPYSNAGRLREISRSLKLSSQYYRKIINDFACMIDTHYRQIIPNVDFTKNKRTEASDTKVQKSYFETAKMLDHMNLPSEMLKVYTECWTVDVFYGCYYYFKDEGGFMFPLDPEFCKIIGTYTTGDFAFALDCSWLRNYEDVIELWGEPFTSMYRAYQSDTQQNRWQEFPSQYACCMKVNLEDIENAIPPLIGTFNELMNLEDLKEIQALQDASTINKLLVFKLPLKNNSNRVNDWALDPKTGTTYYKKAAELITADYYSSIMSPMDIETISFPDDGASDVNKVENAAKNVMKSAGYTILAEPKGQTAVDASLKSVEDYAISSLLPQTQGWVNRMCGNYISTPSKVKFMEVTKYTRQEFKDSLIKDLNYGLPMITALGALNGFSEIELMAMAEAHEMMDLRSLFYPYATAATQGAHHKGDDIGGEETSSGKSSTDNGEESKAKKEAAG